jgi:hypothetical protein
MTRTQLATAILIAVLFPAIPGIAQQTDAEDPKAAESNDAQQSGAEPETNTPPPAPPASDDSPYDYRASEEISEDLSVSFPVDI